MKKTTHVAVILILAVLVIVSGCMNGPSSTTGTTSEGHHYEGATSETQHGEETRTQTETVTETVTETPTTTETPRPNGSIQYDEDENAICEGDFAPDSGCEANETNDGSGPGFSLPDNIVLNVTLQPVLQLSPIQAPNMTYARPLSSVASVPGENTTIEWISVLTSSTDPGKSLVITLHFRNESLLGEYVHPETFMNPLTGRKITYRPTIIRIEEGGEFGKRWEVHLYGGIKGRFTLYRVMGNGLEELQSGGVSFHGSSARFTIENFSEIFPEKVLLRLHAVPMSGTMPEFNYSSEKAFVLVAPKGLIEYQESAFFGIEGSL